MVPLIVGAVAGMASGVLSTARGMHADALITKKELAAIEAKSKAFSEFINYHGNCLDKAYELEKESLKMKSEVIKQVSKLTRKMLKKPLDEERLEVYDRQVTALMDVVTAKPEYFTKELTNKFPIFFPSFDTPSEVGTKIEQKEVDYTKILTNMVGPNKMLPDSRN